MHLINTRATPARCPGCGATTVEAHAEGEHVHCDPSPLDEYQEQDCRKFGERMFLLVGINRQELAHQDRDRLRNTRWPVLAEHACSAAGAVASVVDPLAWNPAWRRSVNAAFGKDRTPNTSEIPPF